MNCALPDDEAVAAGSGSGSNSEKGTSVSTQPKRRKKLLNIAQ